MVLLAAALQQLLQHVCRTIVGFGIDLHEDSKRIVYGWRVHVEVSESRSMTKFRKSAIGVWKFQQCLQHKPAILLTRLELQRLAMCSSEVGCFDAR